MATPREQIKVELEDLRGRGPYVACTTVPPASPQCQVTQFGAARLEGKGASFAWYEQRSDGCPQHAGTGPTKSVSSMEIIVGVSGRTLLMVDARDRVLAPGAYCVRNPDQSVQIVYEPKRDVVFHVLEFSMKWWMKFLLEEAGLPQSKAEALRLESSVRTASPIFKAALTLVGQGFHEGVQSGSPLLVDTAAMQAAFLLLKDHPSASERVWLGSTASSQADPPGNTSVRDRRLQRALDFLEAEFAFPIGLGEIAEHAGLSRSQLVRMFRRELKVTPYQCLMRYRVKKAVEFLRGDAHPSFEAVSKAVGIPNLSHLTRLVRQTTGKTPSEIRRRSTEVLKGKKQSGTAKRGRER